MGTRGDYLNQFNMDILRTSQYGSVTTNYNTSTSTSESTGQAVGQAAIGFGTIFAALWANNAQEKSAASAARQEKLTGAKVTFNTADAAIKEIDSQIAELSSKTNTDAIDKELKTVEADIKQEEAKAKNPENDKLQQYNDLKKQYPNVDSDLTKYNEVKAKLGGINDISAWESKHPEPQEPTLKTFLDQIGAQQPSVDASDEEKTKFEQLKSAAQARYDKAHAEWNAKHEQWLAEKREIEQALNTKKTIETTYQSQNGVESLKTKLDNLKQGAISSSGGQTIEDYNTKLEGLKAKKKQLEADKTQTKTFEARIKSLETMRETYVKQRIQAKAMLGAEVNRQNGITTAEGNIDNLRAYKKALKQQEKANIKSGKSNRTMLQYLFGLNKKADATYKAELSETKSDIKTERQTKKNLENS